MNVIVVWSLWIWVHSTHLTCSSTHFSLNCCLLSKMNTFSSVITYFLWIKSKWKRKRMSEHQKRRKKTMWLSAVVDGSESCSSRYVCSKDKDAHSTKKLSCFFYRFVIFNGLNFVFLGFISKFLHSNSSAVVVVQKNQLRKLLKTKQPWIESTLFFWKKDDESLLHLSIVIKIQISIRMTLAIECM